MATSLVARMFCHLKYETNYKFVHTLCSRKYRNTIMPAACRTFKDETIQLNAEELLENCVVGLDNKAKESPKWSTDPYPKCEVSVRNQALHRKTSNASSLDTTVVLFPGQGSQYVGMGKSYLEHPEAKKLFDLASDILGYDVLELCLNGPKDKLDRTEFSQIAVYLLSLATSEHLKHTQPSVIANCEATAGFSVGEVSALVFAGAISFSEGLKLIQIRAKAMQTVCDEVASGMMTVIYGADSQLEYACLCAKKWCLENGIENPECMIANYLFPHCKVIAGHLQALDFIEKNSSQFKLKRIKRLPVSGAFHTPIMKPAAEPFKKALKKVKLRIPNIPVYSNVDGKMYRGITHIIKQLPQQIYKPVKWEQTLHVLYERPQGENFPNTIECGPGTSLKTCLKMVNSKAWNKCTSVEL